MRGLMFFALLNTSGQPSLILWHKDHEHKQQKYLFSRTAVINNQFTYAHTSHMSKEISSYRHVSIWSQLSIHNCI